VSKQHPAPPSEPIALDAIGPYSTKRPKGFAPYKPNGKTKLTVARITELYRRVADADALPLGPRQVGYRLSMLYPGEYSKAGGSEAIGFKAVEEVVKRLAQAGKIPMSWIADAASVTYKADGYVNLADYCKVIPDGYRLDRKLDQPVVLETVAEARETLPLITRVARERGVSVYSGGGSAGPNLAYKVARRAVRRAVERGQSTLILGISDFDVAGIRNILRPHIEHLAAFLYGVAGNDTVVATSNGDGEVLAVEDTGATVTFQHLALTPEMALELVDAPDRQRIRRYIASGGDPWSRDLDLLDGAPKVETEALDPVDLRNLVVEAIEERLDVDALRGVEERQEADREWLRENLATAGIGQDGNRDRGQED
jgi:hypothetical protein